MTERLSHSEFVFGYGSLAATPGPRPAREPAARGFVADLRGFRREWGVAMDNSRDLPGYRHYTDGAGVRPAVFVCFLDLIDAGDASATVNGLCLPVGSERLRALDARERNYERVDVSHRIAARGARVWTYIGSAEGRARFEHGRAAGTAVIAAAYLRTVAGGFSALGVAAAAASADSLQSRGIPVVELESHPHPP